MSKQSSQSSTKQAKKSKPIPEVKSQLQLVEKVQMENVIPSNPNITDIVPFVSCYVAPEHFEEAVKGYHSEIYTSTPDGKYLKHVKLSHGRHVRMKVEHLPKNAPEIAMQSGIAEELNFLPGGKIPYSFFEQIVAFFRKVIEIKKAEFEAHSYIMWSVTEKKYYIHIPKQVVSKAAVSFTYDMPPGDIIVVDIHSHNTMSSFWSSTDEANDKQSICYSGVIGKITPNSYEYVMRFNLYELKKRCNLDEIFDIPPKTEALVPQEWLDNVDVRSYTPPASGSRIGGTCPQTATHLPRVGTVSKIPDLRAASSRILSGPLVRDVDGSLSSRSPTKSLWDEVNPDNLSGHDFYNSMENMGRASDIYVNPRTGCVEARPDEVEIEADESAEDDDPVGAILGDEYAYNVRAYGVNAADAKDSIDTEISELDGHDDLLIDVIRTAYGMLGNKGRDDLAMNGF